MAQTRIEAATQVKFTKGKNQPYIGVLIKGNWYNIEWPYTIDPRTLRNQTLDLEFRTGSTWAKLAGAPNAQFAAQPPAGFSQIGPILDKVAPTPSPAPTPPPNQAPEASKAEEKALDAAISWYDYVRVIRAAHVIAAQLEPLEGDARARVAIVNTFAIAFTSKQSVGISAPPEEGPEAIIEGDPFAPVGDPDEIRF